MTEPVVVVLESENRTTEDCILVGDPGPGAKYGEVLIIVEAS